MQSLLEERDDEYGLDFNIFFVCKIADTITLLFVFDKYYIIMN